MQQFVAEFYQAYNKLKRHGITICSDLGFKLLKTVNLSCHHEQLIETTITELSYDSNMKKIKSIFSNETENPSTQKLQLKAKPTYCTKDTTSDKEKYDNEKNCNIADTKCSRSILYARQI